MMSYPRLKHYRAYHPLFDGQRMVYGGFTPIVDG
jgi:uncharacterized protein YbaA (DUF1428 family)